MDSEKTRLKAVLLHNGNEKASISIAHVTGLIEIYVSIELVLNIYGDLKVLSLHIRLLMSCTKHPFCVYGTAEMTKIMTGYPIILYR